MKISREPAIVWSSPRIRDVGACTLIAVGVFTYLYVALGMPVYGMHSPLRFSRDSLEFLAQIKATVETGWWWYNPALAAPQGFRALLYPSNTNVDQALVWILRWIWRDAALVGNATWMLLVALSAVTAFWSVRALGISRLAGGVCAVLFALTPYALYRNIEHLCLAIYLIPPLCALAVRLATARAGGLHWKASAGLIAGAMLLGFNYVYYAFFGCFVLLVSIAIGTVSSRSAAVARHGLVILLMMLACSTLNLAPSLAAFERFGYPTTVFVKTPAESEQHGLKIRHLVSPVLHHPLPLFDKWGQKESDAQFPYDAENTTARLGLVATVGFLAALALLVLRVPAGNSTALTVILASAQIIFALVLVATIGGFGSLFSLLVTPDIRGWNRVCPFIAFLSLVTVGYGLDWLRTRVAAAPAILAGVLVFGIWDQSAALEPLIVSRQATADEFREIETMVERVAARLPRGAAVLQLPFVSYQSETGAFGMLAYDHYKPYLASRSSLRWSYPAMTNEQFRWQQAASALMPGDLASSAVRDGFSAILVDTAGYHDAGVEVITGLQSAGATLIEGQARYRVFSLRSVAAGPGVLERPRPTAAGAVCEGEPLYFLDAVNDKRPSAGTEFVIRAGEQLRMSGWLVIPAKGRAALALDVVLDGRSSPAAYGFDRPDVASYYNDPDYQPSGFRVIVPPQELRTGIHNLRLRALAPDRSCYVATSPYTITVR